MNKDLTEVEQEKDIFSFSGGDMVANMKMAEMMSESDLVPSDYKRKPGNIMVCVQMGQEVGLKPMQALQNIAVINGRPTIWGDALIAIARSYHMCEFVHESFDQETMTATCTAKRKDNNEPYSVRFSKDDAITANLWTKQGPWKQYPKRMLQMRARSFCLRDLFPEALKGMGVAEEVQDYQSIKQVNAAPEATAKTNKVSDFIKNSPAKEPVNEKEERGYFEQIEACQSVEELVELSATLAQVPEGEERKNLMNAYNAKGRSLNKTVEPIQGE